MHILFIIFREESMIRKKLFLFLFLVFSLCIFKTAAFAENKMNVLAICGANTAKGSFSKIADKLAENKLSRWRLKSMRRFYYDCSSKPTTKAAFDRLLDSAFKNSKDNDINYFYFAGHGCNGSDDSNKVVFANTGIFLKAKSGYEGVYKYSQLVPKLCKYKGQFIVIIDACFSQNFFKVGLKNSPYAGRFTVLTSTKDNELAMGFLNDQFYSSKLVNALQYKNLGYKCDSNFDGLISLKEIHDSVKYLKSSHPCTYGNNATIVFQFGSVDLKKNSITLDLKNKKTFKLGLYAKKINCTIKQKVKWKSSNNAIVSVNSSGNITAKKPGTAVITAYIADNKNKMCLGSESTCKVTVKNPVITLNKKSLYIRKGKKSSIKATVKWSKEKVKWKSSNKKIVKINSSGKITALKKGTATITAYVNGASAKCRVTVLSKKTSSKIKEKVEDSGAKYFYPTFFLNKPAVIVSANDSSSFDVIGFDPVFKNHLNYINCRLRDNIYISAFGINKEFDLDYKLSKGIKYNKRHKAFILTSGKKRGFGETWWAMLRSEKPKYGYNFCYAVKVKDSSTIRYGIYDPYAYHNNEFSYAGSWRVVCGADGVSKEEFYRYIKKYFNKKNIVYKKTYKNTKKNRRNRLW